MFHRKQESGNHVADHAAADERSLIPLEKLKS